MPVHQSTAHSSLGALLLLAAIAGTAEGRGPPTGQSRDRLISVVRVKKKEKRINKLERYRSWYRYYHNLTVTSRSACPVKVEYLPHDRLSAVAEEQQYRAFCNQQRYQLWLYQ